MRTLPMQPARKSSKNTILIIAAVAVVVGGMSAAVMLLGRKPTDVGMIGMTDVGGLQALADIQAQLRPLRACGVEYGERGRRGKVGSHTDVWVSACENDRFAGVRIAVPTERQVERVAFNLERGSVSEPWKILVDKNQVPFPELERALEQLSPFLAEEVPSRLAQAIEAKLAAHREWQESQAAEPGRRDAAKNSYPE
ncbi:hypothetical protein D7Y13_19765 [Corallococcus praedator]|uniref:DUF3015 domain-containing protein n=2 Tax=Myxococcaceae TaxID=31 RepID=A0ABX9QFQ9_9BACT|nr:hypothetical protein D7X74_18010 [Corallococcus sp. CA047B]RKH27027.1 hypothetical protein D7X75_27360 [Corallococcus sp. CA031C]RKI06671.1 hypothetical protein D7Y13_19765 [Corallococcus praedator]